MKRQVRPKSPLTALALLVIILLASISIWKSIPMTNPAASAFSLLVTLQFSATEHKEQFLRDFQPLADYVRTHEPDTIAYEALQSDKDPLQILLLERYKDKEVAYLQVHRSSTPFLEFRPKLQAMQENQQVTISGHSYVDSGIGFGDRV